MNKETAGHSQKSAPIHKVARKHDDAASMTVEGLLPTGSWQRIAAGVAAAAGGGLLAAAVVGVGPAALAGAAAYLAYRGLSEQRKDHAVGHDGDKA
jgi:hypothetical protein